MEQIEGKKNFELAFGTINYILMGVGIVLLARHVRRSSTRMGSHPHRAGLRGRDCRHHVQEEIRLFIRSKRPAKP